MELARKKITMARVGGSPFQSLEWLDNYVGSDSPAGPNAIKELLDGAATANAEGTMQWVEQREDQFSSEQVGIAFSVAAQALREQAPEKFVAWMNAHRDHPQHDSIAEVTSFRLILEGKFKDAQQWADIIRSPQTRAKIEEFSRNREQMAARMKQ